MKDIRLFFLLGVILFVFMLAYGHVSDQHYEHMTPSVTAPTSQGLDVP